MRFRGEMIRVEIREPIPKAEILEKESKVIRSQGLLFDADLIPKEIARAVLHVFSARLDGDYTTNVKNTGLLPLFRSSLNHTLNQVDENVKLFSDQTQVIGRLGRGATGIIKTSWRVKGALPVLWSLINIFFTGSCTVRQMAAISAFGFNKNFSVKARVPVKAVAVEWN